MLPAADADTTLLPFSSIAACLDLQLREQFGQRFTHYDTIRWEKQDKPNCIAYDDQYNDDPRVIRFTPLDKIAYVDFCPSEYLPTSFHARAAHKAHMDMIAEAGIDVARFESLATEASIDSRAFDEVPPGVYFSQDYLGADIVTLAQAITNRTMTERCVRFGRQLIDAMHAYRAAALASDRQIIMFDVAFARQYALDTTGNQSLTLIDPEPYFEGYDNSTRSFVRFDAALAATIELVRSL